MHQVISKKNNETQDRSYGVILVFFSLLCLSLGICSINRTGSIRNKGLVIAVYLILFCMISSSLVRDKPVRITSGYIPFSSINIPYSIRHLCGSIIPLNFNHYSNLSSCSHIVKYRLFI
jgi:hypothetical protein